MSGQLIDSGYYTPTLTDTTNLDDSTETEFMWFRIGDKVHVSGRVDVDPTAAAPTATVLGISLPIQSAFSSTNDCSGVCAAGDVTEAGIIRANTTSDIAEAVFMAQSTANHGLRMEFTYRLRH